MAKEEKTPGGLSRRDFLRGGAASALAGGLLPGALAEGATESAADANGAEVVGPGAVPVTLKINGSNHKVEVEPRVTLLDALRNHLELTGSKKVCDRATCGACSVLVDGKLAYACSLLAIEVQGSEITTVEGLGSPENMHPVQTAFVEHDAQQCGFCTPGFVVACQAFLADNPNPSMAEIDAGLGGNLCRCGTYAGIRQVLVEGKGGQVNG